MTILEVINLGFHNHNWIRNWFRIGSQQKDILLEIKNNILTKQWQKKKKRKSRRLTWRGGMKDENFSSVEDGARGEKNERENT